MMARMKEVRTLKVSCTPIPAFGADSLDLQCNIKVLLYQVRDSIMILQGLYKIGSLAWALLLVENR